MSQWEMFKEVRLRALEEAPYAFSSTLEGALQKSDDEWQTQTEESATGLDKALFLAFWDDVVCGLTGCLIVGEQGDEADLFSVWVAPDFRRLQVGNAMFEEAKQWAVENGASVLHAWVTENNLGAIRFYKGFGMEETGRREPVRAGSDEEQILLVLPLS